MSFDQFNFDRRIVAGIDSCNFVKPTPIQERAIPIVLEGRDVMGLAQTGTGKTAAFALPILQRLLDDGAKGRGPVRVLVLAPTRELALQIHETFVELGSKTGIRSAAVFGGVGQNPQVRELKSSTVAVACPGRLLDLLNQGVADLSSVDTLVLDEADRMLDMGFLPDIKRILSRLPSKRQNLLFSATMPTEIRKLSTNLLSEPETVQVANTKPVEKIEQIFYGVEKHLKASFVETYLKEHEHESVLVFTRTKHLAKRLGKKLSSRGFSATSLQGNLSQNQRVKALDGFRDGTYQIMFATDIAARGIDCSRISHVINYDVPDTVETYTHRIGRTGRADRTGVAVTLFTRDDNDFKRDLERITKQPVNLRQLDGFDHSAPKPPRENQNTGGRGGRRGNVVEPQGEGRPPRGKGRKGRAVETAGAADAEARTTRGGRGKGGRNAASQEPGEKRQSRQPREARQPREPRQQRGTQDSRVAQGAQGDERSSSPGILPDRSKRPALQDRPKHNSYPRPRPNRKPVEGIGQIRSLSDYAPASETGDNWKEVKDTAEPGKGTYGNPYSLGTIAPGHDGDSEASGHRNSGQDEAPVSQLDSYLYEEREIHDRRPEPGPGENNPYAADFSLDALSEEETDKPAPRGGNRGRKRGGKQGQGDSGSARQGRRASGGEGKGASSESAFEESSRDGKKRRPRRRGRGGKGAGSGNDVQAASGGASTRQDGKGRSEGGARGGRGRDVQSREGQSRDGQSRKSQSRGGQPRAAGRGEGSSEGGEGQKKSRPRRRRRPAKKSE